jgi:hypothetical protein
MKFFDQDEEGPMFANDTTIIKLEEKYRLEFGQDADERFIDFEIYDDPEDQIRVTSVFEMDEQNDLIKKAIRWKKKQLEMLMKSLHFETDEEREKKVKWKKQRKRSINEWEDLIYDMTRSSRNVIDVYNEWKGAGHKVIEAGDEVNYLLYGCDEEDNVLTDESSTEAEPLFPIGLSLKQNDGGAEGDFHIKGFTHNYAIDINVLFRQSMMIISTIYWKSNQGCCYFLLYLKKINPCSSGEVYYAARYHQRAPLGGASFSHINDGIFYGQNPSRLDGSKKIGGGEGSHAIEVTGVSLLDYPRRSTMHTT